MLGDTGVDPDGIIAAAKAKVAQSLAAHRLRVLYIELPDVSDTVAGDNALGAQLDSLESTSLVVCYSFCALKSPLDGWTYKRSSAWPVVSRVRSIGRAEDPAWVGRGKLPDSVVAIFHDENLRQGPDDHRLVTLRSFEDKPGFFITNAWLFSTPGSDYRYVQMRRVINDVARIARAPMLPNLSRGVRTYPSPAPDGKLAGAILEEEALDLESLVNDELLRTITQKGDALKAWIEIDRANPMKQDETLNYRSLTRMPGYIKSIFGDFGFAL